MAKVIGSYASITRGVSEQVPQDRHPGQHYEQVNMVSDPVNGLVRRHGSIMMDEKQAIPSVASLTPAQQAYARNYREYSFFIGGTEYSIVYMSGTRNSGDTLPFCYVLNKVTGKFLNVVYGNQTNLEPWLFGGISAITTVGQYIVMASNSLGPGYSTSDPYGAQQFHGQATVRGGAYSRTYKISVVRNSDGATFNASYTTMAQSYPNLLDTSDIPLTNPDGSTNTNYQKQVNDRVNAYNSAVNQWVGQAAASIQPQNIASQLVNALVSAGYTSIAAVGGSIALDDCRSVTVDDSGDGTLFRAVLNTVTDVSLLSPLHWANKVVQVKPTGADPYYMQAIPDSNWAGTQAIGTVTWKEAPAQVVTPGQVFAIGCVSSDGHTFYLANNAAELNSLAGVSAPGYSSSVAGDINETGNVPYFFGKRVSLLTVFMDRLVIVSDGVIFMSRTGDYFNWFRKSMLTVDDDDPIEVYALGAEDDIISKCVVYDKDLFMFGQRKQYVISGRSVLTPKTVSVSATANEQDAEYAQPVVVGNLLFYGKYEPARNQPGPSPYAGKINQFQLGLFQDTPETYTVSQQLSRYIKGRPIELATLSAPTTLFVRTDGNDNGLYVYSFIDQPGTQTRAFDSWSRWEWDTSVGQIIGLTTYDSSVYVFTLRTDGGSIFAACDQFVMDSDLAVNPYFDAQRTAAAYLAGETSSSMSIINPASISKFPNASVALANTVDRAWLGEPIAQFNDFYSRLTADEQAAAWVGVGYSSYVEITPPFVRDQNDKAIVNGRLVIGRYTVSVNNTGGLDAWINYAGMTDQVYRFNGRRVGISNNQVGMQPITTAALQVPAGRANTEHTMQFVSRNWLPMGLTAIEWVGQLFLSSRRV